MPLLLNPTTPIVYVLGDNARGIEMDWSSNGDATGASVSGVLEDSNGAPVTGWTGTVMTANASILQATSPCRIRWSWPNPLTPKLPVGGYLFYFSVTFPDGRIQHTDSVSIQVVSP